MASDERRRLDVLLVEKGLARGRGEAQSLIRQGRVRGDGQVLEKPGHRFSPDICLDVSFPPRRYASRGGLKLEKALDTFGLDVSGLTCLDIGASTGGFTDCLLSRGAGRVFAVDVGYGLLAWSLRIDPRVVVLDRTNARYLTREALNAAAARQSSPRRVGEEASALWPSLATCDVSFISLLKVVPALRSVLTSPWQMILLVKPQFEAGRELVGARGVVRSADVHVAVLERVLTGLVTEDLSEGGQVEGGGSGVVAGLTFSPIRGPEGNIEYLVRLVSSETRGTIDGRPSPAEVRETVTQAFTTL
jgi:23S rRNA (cytidine1920-2'-O)/16S rRNA (cytidine1409-2'-O)-methyltransferase